MIVDIASIIGLPNCLWVPLFQRYDLKKFPFIFLLGDNSLLAYSRLLSKVPLSPFSSYIPNLFLEQGRFRE